ncbi:hypothetical protein [Alkalimonas sp.]|uniref:hypothetical protein n=1 Tax=Alkalimonas sp. TaxID=1872453 RepID=UPI00263A86AC|nr:hypothetical protein [Alkalimonas sp.]MCC5824871.1 hypothetical protein [Alkalimonas sp.]
MENLLAGAPKFPQSTALGSNMKSLLLLVLFSTSSLAYSDNDVERIFGVHIGKPFKEAQIKLLGNRYLGDEAPVKIIHAPAKSHYNGIFNDFTMRISLFNGAVFQITTHRSFESSEQCITSLRQLSGQLSKDFNQKMNWSEQYQFQSKDKSRWLQLRCGQPVGSPYYILDLNLTDTAASVELEKWFEEKTR